MTRRLTQATLTVSLLAEVECNAPRGQGHVRSRGDRTSGTAQEEQLTARERLGEDDVALEGPPALLASPAGTQRLPVIFHTDAARNMAGVAVECGRDSPDGHAARGER